MYGENIDNKNNKINIIYIEIDFFLFLIFFIHKKRIKNSILYIQANESQYIILENNKIIFFSYTVLNINI